MKYLSIAGACLTVLLSSCVQVPTEKATNSPEVSVVSLPETSEAHRSYYVTSVMIPMRDGNRLAANLVLPGHRQPAPIVVSITPYGRHGGHRLAAGFAQSGLGMLMVDTRGRGDSEGEFEMFYGDLNDTVDVIEWVSEQDFSNGDVAMWGSSYGGYNQWMAAAKGADNLVTIVPGASVYPGWDFPMVTNVGYPYAAIWTGFTKGRNANFSLFNDIKYWSEAFTDLLVQGVPFENVDEFVGFDTDLFDEWAGHPTQDEYWQGINPSDEEMAAIEMPILTTTGLYDGAQLGALRYYEQHTSLASETGKEQHYLIIGPYDHAGVVFATPSVGGLDVPDAGGFSPVELHGAWYAWTLDGAPKPEFLEDRVMYYVMGEGANEWRSAPSLEAIPTQAKSFGLSMPAGAPTAVGRAGRLSVDPVPEGEAIYVYDPTDISKASLGRWFDGDFAIDDQDVRAIDGEGLIFETAPLDEDVELIGQPRFEALISIDTADTDFQLRVYEVAPDGSAVYLSEARARARFRESYETEAQIETTDFLPYIFEDFSFASRHLPAGHRFRFVFAPPNSIFIQRNYNSGKPIAVQTPEDAKTVTVRIKTGGSDGAKLVLPLRDPT